MTHLDLRRIDVITLNGAQITQFDLLPRHAANWHLPERIQVIELSIDTKLNGILWKVQSTR